LIGGIIKTPGNVLEAITDLIPKKSSDPKKSSPEADTLNSLKKLFGR
jgi:hypothetical protein